jgi:hypothetical protein
MEVFIAGVAALMKRINKGDKNKLNKEIIQCYNCKKLGQLVEECKSKMVQGKEYEEQERGEDFDDMLLIYTTESEDDNFDL